MGPSSRLGAEVMVIADTDQTKDKKYIIYHFLDSRGTVESSALLQRTVGLE